MRAVKLPFNKIPQFLTGDASQRRLSLCPYDGRKTVVVVVSPQSIHTPPATAWRRLFNVYRILYDRLNKAISLHLRHISTIGKLVKHQYLRHVSSHCHNMVNFGPLTAEIGSRILGTQQISTGVVSWLRYCSDVAQRRSTKLWTMFGRLLCLHSIYTLLPGAKFTLSPSPAFIYIGSVTARHSSSGRQPNFAAWYKEWNYWTFADGATYIWLGGHHVGHRPTL